MVWKTPTHEVTKGNDWCGKKIADLNISPLCMSQALVA